MTKFQATRKQTQRHPFNMPSASRWLQINDAKASRKWRQFADEVVKLENCCCMKKRIAPNLHINRGDTFFSLHSTGCLIFFWDSNFSTYLLRISLIYAFFMICLFATLFSWKFSKLSLSWLFSTTPALLPGLTGIEPVHEKNKV